MNKKKWCRLTLVLDPKTDADLRFVAGVVNASTSSVVRDVLSEPISFLADNLRHAIENPTPERLERFRVSSDAAVDEAYQRYQSFRSAS
jgi:hypothetical protein